MNVPFFYRPCDTTFTEVTKLHLMRIGSDGASSDVVVKQWDGGRSHVFTATADAPRFHLTDTHTGADTHDVDINAWSIITNADQGALYSWQATVGCEDGEHVYNGYRTVRHVGGCAVGSGPENHLTTSSGGALASDVIWDQRGDFGSYSVPVEPLLQLEDDSYAGTVSSNAGSRLVVFDATGHVQWTLPGYSPVMITINGVVASNAAGTYVLTSDGTSTRQVKGIETYSWRQTTYLSAAGALSQVASQIVPWGTSDAAMLTGNPSPNGTSVGVVPGSEQRPTYTLRVWGGGCARPEGSSGEFVPLGGAALIEYESLRQSLLASGRLLPPSTPAATSMCAAYFNEDSSRRPWITALPDGESALSKGLRRQVPYDGPRTTISLWDGGLYDHILVANYPERKYEQKLKKALVCQDFVKGADASAQTSSRGNNTPVTDVYINSDNMSAISEATLLHELLHNLTGYSDFLDEDSRKGATYPNDLKTFVGIEITAGENPAKDKKSTYDITQRLIDKHCGAGPRPPRP